MVVLLTNYYAVVAGTFARQDGLMNFLWHKQKKAKYQ